MRRMHFLAAPLAAFTASALAGGLEEAKQYLDQAAPQHCELLMMKYQAQSPEGDPAAHEALMAKLYKRAADLERDMAPATRQFEAARAMLTPEERAQLERHASALLQECSSKAAEIYHVRIPMAASEAAPRPRAVPYTPPREKSSQATARPGAIQGAYEER